MEGMLMCASVCIVSFEVYIMPCAGCHHACGVTLLAQVHVQVVTMHVV